MVLLDNGSRAARLAHLIHPALDLQSIVEHFWIQPGPDAAEWRVVPDHAPHVIVVLERAGRPGPGWRASLVGARSVAHAPDVSGRLWTIGVRLRPGALPAIVDLDASELGNRSVGLAAVFSSRALRSLEIAADAGPEEAVHGLARFIRSVRRSTAPAADWAGALARASSVGQLGAMLASPTRTMHARVRRAIGLRPKTVLRIIRLHRALALVARDPSRPWVDVAHAAGYADQPHFVRECRALLNETPGSWRSRGAADSFKTPARARAYS